jgi:chemotaxis protein methyltransferase CheR
MPEFEPPLSGSSGPARLLAGALDASPMLSDAEFEKFRRFILSEAGIDMSPIKRALIQSRLAKRLRELKLGSYGAYWQSLQKPEAAAERQRAINLLSTNETFFFREPQHFVWLQQFVQKLWQRRKGQPIRIWSAACSSGEEVYTIAMVMAECLGLEADWRLCASDINTWVTTLAKRAVFPIERVKKTPPHLWRKYFLRGRDQFSGQVRVVPELTRRVDFFNMNLLHSHSFRESEFDVIFLRNVLIYFNEETKFKVLSQICPKLAAHGRLLISHSEAIHDRSLPLVLEAPSRYRLHTV